MSVGAMEQAVAAAVARLCNGCMPQRIDWPFISENVSKLLTIEGIFPHKISEREEIIGVTITLLRPRYLGDLNTLVSFIRRPIGVKLQ